MKDPLSKIERVKLSGRETVTHLATVDDLIAYTTSEGALVIDFVRWDANRKPIESFRITMCEEDRNRVANLSRE